MTEAELSGLHHYLDRRKALATPTYRYIFPRPLYNYLFTQDGHEGAAQGAVDSTGVLDDAPVLRARWRGLTGLSSATDSEFNRSFYFVVLSAPYLSLPPGLPATTGGIPAGEDGGEALRKAVLAINHLTPTPRFVALHGSPVLES